MSKMEDLKKLLEQCMKCCDDCMAEDSAESDSTDSADSGDMGEATGSAIKIAIGKMKD